MLDADGEHQGAAATVLRHLTGGVAVTLHERHHAGGSKGRVVDGTAFRTQLTEVMSNAATPFHELHLLLVNLHDGAVAVGIAFESDDEAVAQRGHLMVVADAGHRAAGRNHIAEAVEQIEHLLGGDGVLVFLFNTRHLVGNAPVHVNGRLLKDMTEAVLHGILVHPYAGGKLIAAEIG